MSKDLQLIKELSEQTCVKIEIRDATESEELELSRRTLFLSEKDDADGKIFQLYAIDYDKIEGDSRLAILNEKNEVIRLYLIGVELPAGIPGSVFELNKLKLLCFLNNEIKHIPPEIIRLKNLEALIIGVNPVRQLPREIVQLPHLKTLACYELNTSVPPKEVVKQGLAAVKNYFESVSESSQVTYLYEAKMVLIGRGFAGKTSLVRKLTIPDYHLEKHIKSTEGIGIDMWDIDIPLEKSKSFRFNIWDFGGQEKYDATHQFFITERTLYLFVTEARQESNYLDFDYWLNIVHLLGNDSPVIVVQNKIDLRHKNLPTDKYKRLFPNIIDFVDVSCSDGKEETIEELRKKIKEGIRKLPQTGDELPKEWVDIRKALEARKEEYHISYDQYVEICVAHGLNQKKADFLSQYFHNLGVIVHYPKDPLLKKIVVIDPDWAVDAVYNVLDTRTVEQNNGKFCNEDLEVIWSDAKYKRKLPELLAIMKRYELCFALGNSGEYIAPELLPANPKKYQAIEKSARLTFIYQYEFMPAGLLTRFIVKIHKLIEKELFWRHGVIISIDNARAAVIEEEQNRQIRIDIEGDKENKKGLLAIIRKEFSGIYEDFNRKIKYDELVPCNCDECRDPDGESHFFKWEMLKKCPKERKTVMCEKSYTDVDVQLLMGEISDRSDSMWPSESAVPEPAEKKDKWWLTAVIAGVATSLITLVAMILPADMHVLRISVIAGAFVTLFVLLKNPKQRFMRAFSLVFGALGLFNLLPGLKIFFEFENNTFFGSLEGLSNEVNLGLIALLIVLAILDYKLSKK